MKFGDNKGLFFDLLSEQQLNEIHKKTLDILWNVGVKVYNNDLLKRLKKAGAKVNSDIVHFSEQNLKDALEAVPSEFTLYGINDQANIIVSKDKKIVSSYANAVKYYDCRTGSLRSASYADLVNYTRVMEYIDIVQRVAPGCTVTDVSEKNSETMTARGVMLNTTKAMEIAPQNTEELRTYIDLNKIVNCDNDISKKPRFSIVISTTSPLKMDNDTCKNLMTSTENGLPVHGAPCPMGGGTAPFTIAGSLLLTNVEALFILICTQMLKPGTPFIRGGASTIMDLRNGSVAYGSPERNLLTNANSQIARWYGLISATPSGSIDAWEIDVQAGLQKMLTFLTKTFSYGTFYVGIGSLYNGSTISCEQAVIDAEIIKIARRFAEGIQCNEDTYAAEVISQVGHEGDYLLEEHTIEWMRSKEEFYYSDLICTGGAEDTSMLNRASLTVDKIISESKPIFPEKTIEEVERYVCDRTK